MSDAQSAANALDRRQEAVMSKQKIHILYERLSRDDAEKDVSCSIQNQRDFLEKYAEQNGLTPYVHLQDDGYSGTGWSRPGWQELIAQIETGNVKTIVVKNLDRIGRDYLRVGLFLEQLDYAGIRLIAVSDGIDSAAGEDDFTPFRAILAEWYAKDCSKKIRAIFNSRMAQGYHCTGSIPYGYVHNPDNRQEWLIDESAAATVRRIFQLVIEGKGVYQIANILAADKVLIPSAHLREQGLTAQHDYKDPALGAAVSWLQFLNAANTQGLKSSKRPIPTATNTRNARQRPKMNKLFS